jgi:hypothetical protein
MIDDFMSRNSMTVEQLHAKLDIDGDGEVTEIEFLTRMQELGVSSTLGV